MSTATTFSRVRPATTGSRPVAALQFLAAFFEESLVSTDFEVQSKALSLISKALKQHPKTTAKYLKDRRWRCLLYTLHAVLTMGNYVSTVQFLSLLSDLLVV